jgi:heterodisulfide reductase subunit C
MDLYPHQVIRRIILGERRKVLASSAPWVCLQCAACSVRCPNGIDVAAVLERLRTLAAGAGEASKRREWIFDTRFLESVRRNGRLYELGAILAYKRAAKSIFADMGLGIAMLRTGRLSLMPHRTADRKGFREMLGRLGRARAGGGRVGGPAGQEN